MAQDNRNRTNRKPRTPKEHEEQRAKACLRRRLPHSTTIEHLLEFEYRRGMQVAILATDDPQLARIANRIKAQHQNGDNK